MRQISKSKGLKMQVTFKVEGFEELFKEMNELAEEVGKGKTARIWRNSLFHAMAPVLAKAKQLAPKDTGQLADNLYIKVQKPQGRDKASKYYDGEMYMARVTAYPKRNDSVEKTVLTKRGNFQTYSVNKPVAISQEIGNRHLQNSEFGTGQNGSHPFLRPALESEAMNIPKRLGQFLWAELTWGKYSKG
jgi:hypothetical protein